MFDPLNWYRKSQFLNVLNIHHFMIFYSNLIKHLQFQQSLKFNWRVCGSIIVLGGRLGENLGGQVRLIQVTRKRLTSMWESMWESMWYNYCRICGSVNGQLLCVRVGGTVNVGDCTSKFRVCGMIVFHPYLDSPLHLASLVICSLPSSSHVPTIVFSSIPLCL